METPAFPVMLRCVRLGDPVNRLFKIIVQEAPDVVSDISELVTLKLGGNCTAPDISLYRVRIERGSSHSMDQSLSQVYTKIQNRSTLEIATFEEMYDVFEDASNWFVHLVVHTRLESNISGKRPAEPLEYVLQTQKRAKLAPMHRKAHYLKVSGPFIPGDGYVKYPPDQRYPFDVMINHLQRKTPVILHGPYHSGKSSILWQIEWELLSQGIEMFWLWGDGIAPSLKRRPEESLFYEHVSWRLVKQKCSREWVETYLESYVKSQPICFIVDELQSIMEYDFVANFFRFLGNAKIPYVAAGTFRLQDLNWKDQFPDRSQLDTASPFNKAEFFRLPPLTTVEMATVLQIFQDTLRVEIPMRIKMGIMAEAGGHAASLNALMLFYLYEEPDVGTWPDLLEIKFEEYMNGVKHKIRKDLTDPSLRQLVRQLSVQE
ncbi:hypothetical protein VTN77DRAFT_7817 [Rasamsonia byssochlamydoides]|uniref:uncharacterized protein n=1 Tax=Rasamsonia byssochlamydoides TaxID=89139 RepID=UPI0037423D38